MALKGSTGSYVIFDGMAVAQRGAGSWTGDGTGGGGEAEWRWEMGNGKRDGDASTDVRPSHFPHCQSSLTIACIQRQASSRHFYRGGTSPIEHVTTYSGVTWRKSFALDAPVGDSAPRCNESPGRARGNSTLPLNGGHRVTGLLNCSAASTFVD